MKYAIYLSCIILALLTACKDKDDPENEDPTPSKTSLISNKWKKEAYLNNGVPSASFTQDTIELFTNGTGKYKYTGATQVRFDLTWYFNSSETEVFIFNSTLPAPSTGAVINKLTADDFWYQNGTYESRYKRIP
jgi:hypothetical protein